MSRNKPFVIQLVIVGGFTVFIYIFFALTTSIYRDYQLEVNIEKFENEIENLAALANQKPKDVEYYQSEEYKDKYAKESLNLLNPGEKLIIIPQEDTIVKSEIIIERTPRTDVLNLPNRNQWWEYFFGRTLSVSTNQGNDKIMKRQDTSDKPTEDLDTEYNVDEESLLEIEG
jgi:cell division protein FtsB